MTFPDLYQHACTVFPRPVVDIATPWLLSPDLIRILETDPLSIEVIDPEFPEEPLVLTRENDLFPCPLCVDAETVCPHTVAATMKSWQWAAEETVPLRNKEDLDPTAVVHQHEPHSLTLKATTQHGYEALLCLRGFDAQRLFRQAAQLEALWSERGWTAPYGRSTPTTYAQATAAHAAPAPQPQPQQGTPPGQTPAPAHPPAPTTMGTAPGALVFHPDRLEASFLNGKWYWAMFGPDMPRSRMKHGIRIWEEGLATAGWHPQTLNKEQPPDVRGYLAEYVLKPDGTPDKVIRLIATM